TEGTWKCPLAWEKAGILQNEYFYYQHKYMQSGIIAREVGNLQIDVSKLLDGYYSITDEITRIPYDPGISLSELLEGKGRECKTCGKRQNNETSNNMALEPEFEDREECAEA